MVNYVINALLDPTNGVQAQATTFIAGTTVALIAVTAAFAAVRLGLRWVRRVIR